VSTVMRAHAVTELDTSKSAYFPGEGNHSSLPTCVSFVSPNLPRELFVLSIRRSISAASANGDQARVKVS
jgi:hypothetical protein